MATETTQWKYEPDTEESAAGSSVNQTVAWEASEYIDHQRGVSWYFLLVLATIILTAAVYLITKDYFAGGTIVAVGAIVGSVAHWKPRQVQYELSSQGFSAGEKFYPYSQFKSFAIVRDGHLNSLVLAPTKRLMPPIAAFFEATDEEAIVNLIGEHLPVEDKSPDRIDRLTKKLRF